MAKISIALLLLLLRHDSLINYAAFLLNLAILYFSCPFPFHQMYFCFQWFLTCYFLLFDDWSFFFRVYFLSFEFYLFIIHISLHSLCLTYLPFCYKIVHFNTAFYLKILYLVQLLRDAPHFILIILVAVKSHIVKSLMDSAPNTMIYKWTWIAGDVIPKRYNCGIAEKHSSMSNCSSHIRTFAMGFTRLIVRPLIRPQKMFNAVTHVYVSVSADSFMLRRRKHVWARNRPKYIALSSAARKALYIAIFTSRTLNMFTILGTVFRISDIYWSGLTNAPIGNRMRPKYRITQRFQAFIFCLRNSWPSMLGMTLPGVLGIWIRNEFSSFRC